MPPTLPLSPTGHAPPTRLLLVDVHAVSRQSSRLLLDALAGLEVVGETGEHEEALRLCATLQPAVVILGMWVQGASGPETARAMVQRWPGMRLVFWTLFDDPEHVRTALDAGAHAYVLKQDPAEEMARAIHTALQGHIYLPPSLRSAPIPGELHAPDAHR